MQRRKSKDIKRPSNSKKKSLAKKITCNLCHKKVSSAIHIQKALLKKYSSYQLPYYLIIQQQIANHQKKHPQNRQKAVEYLQKYYKPIQRKNQFQKAQQIYQLHKEAPRLFMPCIMEVLAKRHHRKRLLQYFKIAKILGIKMSGGKTSTFLYSLSKTCKIGADLKSFENILGQISGYQFSQEIQKQLIDTLQGKQLVTQSHLNPELKINLVRQKTKDSYHIKV